MYEDGSGVSAAYTRMDGVTKEMIHWWNVWVQFDPLRYQMWLPDIHLFMASPTEKDGEQLLDKKIPLIYFLKISLSYLKMLKTILKC